MRTSVGCTSHFPNYSFSNGFGAINIRQQWRHFQCFASSYRLSLSLWKFFALWFFLVLLTCFVHRLTEFLHSRVQKQSALWFIRSRHPLDWGQLLVRTFYLTSSDVSQHIGHKSAWNQSNLVFVNVILQNRSRCLFSCRHEEISGRSQSRTASQLSKYFTAVLLLLVWLSRDTS